MAKPWKILDLNPDENLKQCLHKIALTRFQETFFVRIWDHERGRHRDSSRYASGREAASRNPENFQGLLLQKRNLRSTMPVCKTSYSHWDWCESTMSFLPRLQSKKESRPADRKVIDLLIARETTARVLHRRLLVRELKFLRTSSMQIPLPRS